MTTYHPRLVDGLLDEYSAEVPAVVLRGARAVGKSVTASRRASTVYQLEEPRDLALLRAQPDRLATDEPPVLIDEWQLWPDSWSTVRRLVDKDFTPNRFLLTGSASPVNQPLHPGAGRYVFVQMMPMSLVERGLGEPSVSLGELLRDGTCDIDGTSDVQLADYAEEIVASGFPGLRHLSHRSRQAFLDSYLESCFSYALANGERGGTNRRYDPAALRHWATSYATALATSSKWETIRDSATPGERDKPGKKWAATVRDTLLNAYVLDPVDAWQPAINQISRLGDTPKHHFTDPALASKLLNINVAALLKPGAPQRFRDKTRPLIGPLFESLLVQSVRVYAQRNHAAVHHLRTWSGDHEVDLIVTREDGCVVALEVKLVAHPDRDDFRHLEWLRRTIGDQLIDAAVITTGQHAYRDAHNGIAVIPAALLGP